MKTKRKRKLKKRRILISHSKPPYIFVVWIICFIWGIVSAFQSSANAIEKNDNTSIAKLNPYSQPKEIKPLRGKILVIDAGHGGVDPGSIGVFEGIKESELNLQIAKTLEAELEKLGATIIMTRTEDVTRQLGDLKKLTMAERKEIIENAEADMLISVHQNFNEDSDKVRGVQVLLRHDQDLNFATKLQNEFNSNFETQLYCLQDNYEVLSFGQQPSFIIECGFLSNAQDERLLQDTEYQQDIVKTLVNEVTNYWNINQI